MTSNATCDRKHVAPMCADPACFREETASKADAFLPGLGDLVRRGLLDPGQKQPPSTDTGQWAGPAKILSSEDPPSSWKAAALQSPFRAATGRLSDEELASWVAAHAGLYKSSAPTYLRLIVDELRERRAAEAAFAEIDQRFQAVDCEKCDEEPGYCAEHIDLVRAWRRSRAELCDQARIHRQRKATP